MLYNDFNSLIGNTPLLRLNNFEKKYNLKSQVYAKLEYFNPTGSVKDRIAREMIVDALKKNIINQETTIIEPTSGNTGIGLAAISASLGLKCVIIMPSSMSKERVSLMKAYGAEVILSDGKLGMKGSVELANEMHNKIENSFIPSQFNNPNNPLAHFKTTAEEIDEDLSDVDVVVSGIGTGGTITGLATYFKDKNKKVKIVGVEPASSPLLTKGYAGPHKIQGIGANFVPEVLNKGLLDEVIDVADEDAIAFTKEIAKLEGVFVGISSGAALYASYVVSLREEMKGKKIVVILPDSGMRYLSVLEF